MRRVLARRHVQRTRVVVAQRRLEIGVCAVLDHRLRTLARRQAAQIGQPLLGHQHLHVVLGVIHMRHHRHDARNRPALRLRRRHEDRQIGVARKVARAADAVHDLRAHHMGGIDVAVDVGLDHAVHRNHAQPPNHLGVVADLLRAQNDALTITVEIGIELGQGLVAERKRRRRRARQLARLDHLQHAVLQHFGIGGQIFERALVEPRHHRIGNIAHARLQRQQAGRQAPLLHLVLQKLDDVAGDLARVLVRWREGRVAVGAVGLDHRHDLGRVAAQIRLADAVRRLQQRNRQAVRRQLGAVIDVVHAFEARILPAIDLENHLVRLIQPGLVVAHRGRRHQAAVLQNAGHFHHRHIELAQKAEPHKLRHMRQVDIDVLHLAGVDALAAFRVGLIRQTHLDTIHRRQRAVEIGRGRRARPHAHAEALARRVCRHDAPRQRRRQHLRVTRAGKAAHADIGTVVNQACGFVGRHDLAAQGCVMDAGFAHRLLV